jgi:leucyl-tRNA synthetase
MSPFTPHLCHTLWQAFSGTDTILQAPWPEVDESALVKSNIDMMIQVNGKLRGKISIDANMDRDTIQQLALADEKVQSFIANMAVRKVIVVPNKLVNIVVS